MFSTLKSLRSTAEVSLGRAKAASYALNQYDDLNKSQKKAVYRALHQLTTVQERLNKYGSNPLKRLVRWFLCRTTMRKVDQKIADLKLLTPEEHKKNELTMKLRKQFHKAIDDVLENEKAAEFKKNIDALFIECSDFIQKYQAVNLHFSCKKTDLNLSKPQLKEQQKKAIEKLDEEEEKVNKKWKYIYGTYTSDFNTPYLCLS